MKQVVTLTGFETKTGQNDSGGWTLYLFSSAGGAKYQTFDDDLGDAALKLINQPADVEYDVQEREYTDKTGQKRTGQNNVIRSIRAASDGTSGGGSDYHPGYATQGARLAPPIGTPVEVVSKSDYETERQLRIMRQSALDRAISTVAAGIVEVSDPRDLFSLSETYITYFEQGAAAFTPEEAKF